MIISFIAILTAYLLGSLSGAILLAKCLHQQDPRTQGSKNAGATNVLRTQGKKQALFVLLFDLGKGVLAVLIAKLLHIHEAWVAFAGLAAVVGHIFPLYFHFKGGKGVATAIGVLLAFSPLIALLTILVFLAVVLVTRYVSLASMIGAFSAVIFTLFLKPIATLPILLMTFLIIVKHQDNIRRLKEGRENKLRF